MCTVWSSLKKLFKKTELKDMLKYMYLIID